MIYKNYISGKNLSRLDIYISIQDIIPPNPSENEPPDQSTGEWKKKTTRIVGDSMIERG